MFILECEHVITTSKSWYSQGQQLAWTWTQTIVHFSDFILSRV